jgi:RhoGAP domain
VYQTLRKIIDHLREIDKYAEDNKMSACNLSMVWAQNLLKVDVLKYEQCKDVVLDLIQHFDDVFVVTVTSDKTVEQKDEIEVWIKSVLKQETESVEANGHYMMITVASEKTVYNVCKEQADQGQVPVSNITMIEVLLNGALKRPMHPNEIIIDSVLRWDNFATSDQPKNHFVVTPSKFFYHTEVLSKLKNTFFVNYMNSVDVNKLTAYMVIVEDGIIKLMDKNQPQHMKKLGLGQINAYLGVDPKKYGDNVENAITLYEWDEKDRSVI